MPKIINDKEVYRAVLDLLARKGYDGLTTSDMAAVADIHAATLFRKYGSKQRLIEEAIAEELSHTLLNEVTYTGDLAADLEAIVAAYMATVTTYGQIIPRLLLEIPRHAELRTTLQAPLTNIQKIIDILQRYQQDGLLKKEPPFMTVNVLLGPLMVYQMYHQALPDRSLPDIDLEQYVADFLSGRKQAAA